MVNDVGMQYNIHMHFTDGDDDDDDDDGSDQYLFVTTSANIIHLFIHFIWLYNLPISLLAVYFDSILFIALLSLDSTPYNFIILNADNDTPSWSMMIEYCLWFWLFSSFYCYLHSLSVSVSMSVYAVVAIDTLETFVVVVVAALLLLLLLF